MTRFQKTVSESEVRSTYLNLTDDLGRTYGSRFPAHRTRLAIIDGADRRTSAQKHHDNQIWGAINNWFARNDITPGTRVEVRFDPDERSEDGLHVVHLIPLAAEAAALPPVIPVERTPPKVQEPPTEIPISLERQLEDFLASNLHLVEPGLRLFRDEDGREGRQYPTDAGVIDLLCVRASGDLLVVELKRSRSSDVVVGQISRYMGWVMRHLARDKAVGGLILTYESDPTLRYAVLGHHRLALKRFTLRLEIADEEP